MKRFASFTIGVLSLLVISACPGSLSNPDDFIDGGVAKGFPKGKVSKLWDQIVPFAKYGFNKSHSVAYAHVAYQTAYLKTHFPAHFMAAMLTSEVANSDKLYGY